MDKKQPPKAIGIVSTSGLRPLVLSSYLPPLLKQQFPHAKVYLFADKNTVRHYGSFGYDGAFVYNWRKFLISKWKGIGFFIDLDQIGDQNFSEPERYLSLIRSLGLEARKLDFKLKISASIYHEIQRSLIDKGFDLKNLTVVAPHADPNDFSFKTWPHFKEYSKNLKNFIVLPNEEFNFEQTVALISFAKKFIGVDGLWTDVARQLGVPTKALFGPSIAPQFSSQPYFTVLKSVLPCSPCQRSPGQFDKTCKDNVCMKSHAL